MAIAAPQGLAGRVTRVADDQGTPPARAVLPRRISEHELADRIEAAPSRRHMARPRPRADFLSGISELYEITRTLALARGPRYRTSWRELLEASSYTNAPSTSSHLSVMRCAAALREIGLLHFQGVPAAGTRRALAVELVGAELPCAARPGSSADRATGGGPSALRRLLVRRTANCELKRRAG